LRSAFAGFIFRLFLLIQLRALTLLPYMAPGFISRIKGIFIYGLSMALLLFLLKWLEMRFVIIDHAFEIYAGGLAILFTALGIWLALKLTRRKVKTVVVEKEIRINTNDPFRINEGEVESLGISRRELEVLQLMASGLSNIEIAERMFVSLNTIKTHSSRLFEKLEVKRRTQAVEKAKRLQLIP
jgi:two-component system, NarL family, response regulator LiaR